ncbi:MAG: hypothetical protein R6U15_03790 [Candidatus Izemoplasmatales bacterium]
MKKICLTLNIILLSLLFVNAQEPKVKNVDLKIENNKVLINYDLIGNKIKNNNHNIELFFIDDRYTIKVPKSLDGDIGEDINPGMNKTIEWEVFEDDISIAQKLQPKIIVNGIKKGGSKNAYLSMLVPGLGDYFVKDHREMIIKPYIRTISTLGLIGLGIYAGKERSQEPMMSVKYKTERYDSNNDGVINYNDITRTVEVPILIGTETKNWLFPNDAEVFYISGAILWIADIVWVFAKGSENEKLKMFSNYSFDVKSHNGFTGFNLSYKF